MIMESKKPKHIPIVVSQAIAWLDKMKIAYRYIPEAQLWEFVYDGLYMLLINECEDNEFGLYAPMLITDTDDEEIRKTVYECSTGILEMEVSSNCDYGYDGDGICHIAQWWGIQSKNPRLTRKVFEEKLKEMHEYQIKMHFILQGTYESMFNPPSEVMREIFKDLKTDEANEK